MMSIYRFALAILVGTAAAFSISAQKVGSAEVIAGHLASLGPTEVRAAEKNRIGVGDASVRFVTGSSATAAGRIVIAGESGKVFLGMNFDSNDYPREAFAFDGKSVAASTVRDGIRSVLGNFVLSNDRVIKESLLGGVLFSSWGPANLGSNKAKMGFDGIKKVGDRQLYVLSYSPKGGTDFKVKLFFETDTFRHVRSEYTRIFSAGIGKTPDESSRFVETRLKLTEDFSDFRAESGLVLPHRHTIFYSISGQKGTTEIEWKFVYTEFAFNQDLAPGTFDANAG
jgi:hypothetical protein